MAPFVAAIAETLATPPQGLSSETLLAMREQAWRSKDADQLPLPMPTTGDCSS